MNDLKLTDIDRLILANQYEIMSVLNENPDDKLTADALRSGHKWLYNNCFETLSENLPDKDERHVLDILTVYQALKNSYRTLSDKTGITVDDVTFPGFDGNNESELLDFADALVSNRKFTEVLGTMANNSHTQTTARYSGMIAKWKAMDKPHAELSNQQMKEILGR